MNLVKDSTNQKVVFVNSKYQKYGKRWKIEKDFFPEEKFVLGTLGAVGS
jgi:hypothetical protein